jgi:hypothetical protein
MSRFLKIFSQKIGEIIDVLGSRQS